MLGCRLCPLQLISSSFPAHFPGHGAVPALRAPLAAPCSCSTRNSPGFRPARHFFVHHMQCEHPWCCTMLPASAPPGTAKQSCAALTEHPALCPARAAHAKACKTLKAWKTGGKSRKHQFFRLCCSVWLHASLRKGDPPCPGDRTQKGATAALSGGEQGSALCWSLDPTEKFSFPKS